MFKFLTYFYRQTLLHFNRFIPFLTSFSFCLDTKRNKKIKKFRNSLRSNSGISGRTPKELEISRRFSQTIAYIFLFVSFNAQSADFEVFFPHLIRVEGTFFTVTQYDAGGATKFGVTYAVYQTWCSGKLIEVAPCDKDSDGKITTNDLRLTVLRDVKPLYKSQYWDVCKGDLIEKQAVAELFTDMVVHCGTGYNQQHIKALQKIVGVHQDGKIGPKTLRAINLGNSSKIYADLSKYRKSFYKKLTLKKRSQRKFLKGWYERLLILKQIHYSHEKVTKLSPLGFSGVVPLDSNLVYGCYRQTTQQHGFIGHQNRWQSRF